MTEFTGEQTVGSIKHTFAVGMELSKEKADVWSGAIQDNATSNCTALTPWCADLNHPNSGANWQFAWSKPAQASTSQIDTVALYGFDTVKLNEQWLLNGGLRMDHYRLNVSGPAGGRAPNNYPAYDLQRSDTLWNYQLGVVYKPAANGSIYASLGTSPALAAPRWAMAAKTSPSPPMPWPICNPKKPAPSSWAPSGMC